MLAALLLIAAGVAAGLILLPSYIIVQKNIAALSASTAASNASTTVSSDATFLKRAQLRIDEIAPLVTAATTSDAMIIAVLSARPAGVSIDHINYSAGKIASIVITGMARTGDQVNAYQHALLANGQFASVSVPVGALAGVGEGHFTMTITSK